jgi:hypothetical protein
VSREESLAKNGCISSTRQSESFPLHTLCLSESASTPPQSTAQRMPRDEGDDGDVGGSRRTREALERPRSGSRGCMALLLIPE